MSQKSLYPLKSMYQELHLEALLHFDKKKGLIAHIGDETLVNAIIKSNFLVVLQAEMAMPIRLPNNEIYEMVLLNSRGFAAKEGRTNRYLIALKLDDVNILAAVGDDLDPGIILFELIRHS
ncbi:MAG: hypothetical protein ACXAC8_01210 [Candidatus Hodarchaeales archaeon]